MSLLARNQGKGIKRRRTIVLPEGRRETLQAIKAIVDNKIAHPFVWR
jgi:hypothetical protein